MDSSTGQIKDYKISICFSANHTAFRSKKNDRLRLWIRKMCSSEASYLHADSCFSEYVSLVQSIHHLIECNLFSPSYSWQIAHLALNKNHSHINSDTLCFWVVLYNQRTQFFTVPYTAEENISKMSITHGSLSGYNNWNLFYISMPSSLNLNLNFGI